jgi:hypothetical protein
LINANGIKFISYPWLDPISIRKIGRVRARINGKGRFIANGDIGYLIITAPPKER